MLLYLSVVAICRIAQNKSSLNGVSVSSNDKEYKDSGVQIVISVIDSNNNLIVIIITILISIITITIIVERAGGR